MPRLENKEPNRHPEIEERNRTKLQVELGQPPDPVEYEHVEDKLKLLLSLHI